MNDQAPLFKEQAIIMLELQSKMNAKVNPAWLKAGYPYLRAVVIEASEAMEHHGWKWWKAHTCDMAQLQMELVDVWHFILSHLLLNESGNIESTANYLCNTNTRELAIEFDNQTYKIPELDLISKLELLIGLSAARKTSIPLFEALLSDCDMRWDDLYRQYIGKNVLNFFRQDHGYKEGTYVKIWFGQEDNEHLVEILSELDVSHPEFKKQLYNNLKERYSNVALNS